MSTVSKKVYRLIIGTHSIAIHAEIKELFKNWIHISEVSHTTEACFGATLKYMRGDYKSDSPDRFRWNELIQQGCYYDSPFGKVNQCDGELIFDNPNFVNREKAFSLEDKTLVIDDLL